MTPTHAATNAKKTSANQEGLQQSALAESSELAVQRRFHVEILAEVTIG
jgi:hypothetical protein